jgi:phosphoserine phosphatase
VKNCRALAVTACLFLSLALGLAPFHQAATIAREKGSTAAGVNAVDPLPSWSAGKTKERIVKFVKDITDPSAKTFVPVADRIATFDNDGTILCEKPTYSEAIYSHDRARQVQDKHPEWANNPNVQKFLNSTIDGLAEIGASVSIMTNAESNAGLTEEDMHEAATKWLDSAKHPRFDVLYKKLYYPPMIELLNYLKANDFKVYLCSGGQTYFMRCYAQEEYGIAPPEIMGSSLELEYMLKNGRSEIEAKPKIQCFNVGNNKPISISQHIGKRPVIACGNSDGDLQMLTYAGDRKGPSLSILVHHDDSKREYSYDKGAEKVLPLAADKEWLVVSMKDDFKKVFSFDK